MDTERPSLERSNKFREAARRLSDVLDRSGMTDRERIYTQEAERVSLIVKDLILAALYEADDQLRNKKEE